MHALVRTALTSCLLALALPGQITVALHRVDVGPSPIANALPVVDANGARHRGPLIAGEDRFLRIGQFRKVRIRPVGEGSTEVWVDRNDDGDFDDETGRTVPNGERVEVAIDLARGAGMRGPYRCEVRIREDAAGFLASQCLRLRGTFRGPAGTERDLEVCDLDCDGILERSDLTRATLFRIDRDGDGEIGGPGENLSGDAVFRVDGESLCVGEITADGSQLILEPAPFDVPALGSPLDLDDLRNVAGEPVPLSGGDRPRLIAVWASWCSPCIQKMPRVGRIAEAHGADVVWYTVDEKPDVEKAVRIAREKGLDVDTLVAPGVGAQDRLWRMLRSMNAGTIGIPQYAVLDPAGTLRYGGQDLDVAEIALRDPSRTTRAAVLEDPAACSQRVILALHGDVWRGTIELLGEAIDVRFEDADGRPDDAYLAIDRNRDGRFVGPDELLRGDMPFLFAGASLQLARLDGESAAFRRAGTSVLQVGRTCLDFFLRRVDGQTTSLSRFEAPIVLVFHDDDAERLDTVAAVADSIRDADHVPVLLDLTAADGTGETEREAAAVALKEFERFPLPPLAGRPHPLWCAVAGRPGVGLRLPAFAVLDSELRLRWAGTSVTELRARLRDG